MSVAKMPATPNAETRRIAGCRDMSAFVSGVGVLVEEKFAGPRTELLIRTFLLLRIAPEKAFPRSAFLREFARCSESNVTILQCKQGTGQLVQTRIGKRWQKF
jgi:hypothetical protein